MSQYKKVKMCNECPFRKKSPKGWLGPWTAEEMQSLAHSENEFICHKEVNKLSQTMNSEEIGRVGNHCVGMLRYRNNICKSSKNPKQREHQQKLKKIDDQEVIPAFGFLEHHTL